MTAASGPPDRWATFDCYGTLVDWEAGIASALADLWPHANVEDLLSAYHDIEPGVQRAEPGLSYREVMGRCLRGLADLQGLVLPSERVGALGDSLPGWPVFPEVAEALQRLRERGWRLGILSNTDPDLLQSSLETIGVPVDLTITAHEAGSYKPARGHWDRFFERSDAAREGHIHVAASLYHDIQPCSELGLRSVWINRLDEMSNLPRDGELPDLSALPDTLDVILPVEHLG